MPRDAREMRFEVQDAVIINLLHDGECVRHILETREDDVPKGTADIEAFLEQFRMQQTVWTRGEPMSDAYAHILKNVVHIRAEKVESIEWETTAYAV